MAQRLVFKIEGALSGTRLDVFLAQQLALSRSLIAHLVASALVDVDGVPRKPSFRLKAGMVVEVPQEALVPQEIGRIEPCDIPLEILYEDDWILVVNKPAGLVVHPGAGTRAGTLVNALVARYPDLAGVGSRERPGIVHRLDKLTSGVMVVARCEESYRELVEAFKAHRHTRIYTSICHGHLPQPSGRIETLMGRNPRERTRMSARVPKGRLAVTHWEVQRVWPGFSLVELRLETGRTHQIRVHLAEMACPVVADSVYGGRGRIRTIRDEVVRERAGHLGRQMLHASLLGMRHPARGELMEFHAPLPDDMAAFIAVLDERLGGE